MLGPCRWIMIALVGLCCGWHCADLRADEKTPVTAKTKAASPQQIRSWIEQLDSESFRKREAATRALQSAGSAVIGPLGQAVGKQGPEVAWRAVVVLKEICISGDAAASDEAAAVLQKLTESANRSIVADAQRVLESWKQVRHGRAAARIAQLGGRGLALNGTTIYRLMLDDNWQGDTDDLRLLTHLDALSYLELRGEKFTDAAVPHLVRIAGLTQLNLYSTAISVKGGKTLQAQAPNTNIYWFGKAVLGVQGDITGGGGKGCRITGVPSGTGAHQAGVQAGDLITKLDDEVIKSFSNLTRAMVGKKVGQKVKIDVLRGEETLSLEVTLGERSQIEQPRVLPFPAP